MNQLIVERLTFRKIKTSQSLHSSPILLVKKKEGWWPFCVDYRALNALTIKELFPVPAIDEQVDELNCFHYFIKLNSRAGYHQICMSLTDTHKATFPTHQGHYEILVTPFGWTNFPLVFKLE